MQRRRARGAIDTTPFADLIEAAAAEYGADSTHAIRMSQQALTIKNKRMVWDLRLELRAAEQRAQALCRESPDFCCTSPSPCGTGSCRFATGDLVFLELKAPASRVDQVHSEPDPELEDFQPTIKLAPRPVDSLYAAQPVEVAVRPLQAARAASA